MISAVQIGFIVGLALGWFTHRGIRKIGRWHGKFWTFIAEAIIVLVIIFVMASMHDTKPEKTVSHATAAQ